MSYNVICPYCGQPAVLVTGREIYPHRQDLYDLRIYSCKPCKAYVGTHKQTGKPLGRLANKDLRKLKSAAHRAFDPIWEDGKRSRKQAYSWLAGKMNIHPDDCHIGMFSEQQCEQVIDICNQVRLNVIRARNGAEKIFRKEGMNVELFRSIENSQEAYTYLIKEFLPYAKSRLEFHAILTEAGLSSTNFIALVWARRNPMDPFAQEIEAKMKAINPHNQEVEF